MTRYATDAAVGVCLLVGAFEGAHAQTDYYNLDRGRPLQVEDALVIERHAFELQFAPIRWSGSRLSGSMLEVEPEIAWGAFPRLQIEVGVPLVAHRVGGQPAGAAGIEASALYALNAETTSWPGLALAVASTLPGGPLGPDRPWTEVTMIATRTLSAGRVHVNVGVAPGQAARAPHDAARWRAGVAVDRTLVIHSALLGAELVAERPAGSTSVTWNAGAGMRLQLTPRSALDVGGGWRSAGDEPRASWYLTMGSALSLGLLHRFGGVR
jgi:hypothetical protein